MTVKKCNEELNTKQAILLPPLLGGCYMDRLNQHENAQNLFRVIIRSFVTSCRLYLSPVLCFVPSLK